jgi:hypothetical protein
MGIDHTVLFAANWLQVLGHAEVPQIDQGIRQQLHPMVVLLHMLKTQEQSFAFVLHAKVRSMRTR